MNYFVCIDYNHILFSCVFKVVQYVPGTLEPPVDIVIGSSYDLTLISSITKEPKHNSDITYAMYVSDVKFFDSLEKATRFAGRYRIMS